MFSETLSLSAEDSPFAKLPFCSPFEDLHACALFADQWVIVDSCPFADVHACAFSVVCQGQISPSTVISSVISCSHLVRGLTSCVAMFASCAWSHILCGHVRILCDVIISNKLR